VDYTALTLPLFMARVTADDEDHASAAYNLATFADALDAGADLHVGNISPENGSSSKANQYNPLPANSSRATARLLTAKG